MLDRLPKQYHKFLSLFDLEYAKKHPNSRDCNHRIELITTEDKLCMGPIYQLSQGDEKILVQYFAKMIREKKIRPSSSSVRSPIVFIPILNGQGLPLYVDYRHLKGHAKKDKTPLPIMDKLSRKMTDFNFITKVKYEGWILFIPDGYGS
jgi:hypothetical protein